MSSATFILNVLPNTATATSLSVNYPKCSLRLNPIPTTAYIAYMSHLFLFPPTPSVPSQALAEATNLSLNFAYLIPIFFPHLTPANHPMLEAIFHIIVAWALLLIAFVSDSIPHEKQPSIPAAPFLIGAAFLTNILYLPYLALRQPHKDHLPKLNKSALLNFAESRALPIFSTCLFLASLLWGFAARPQFGDFSTRLQSFYQIVENDILAYSFTVDLFVFSLFQAWLVPDDANRRKWPDEEVHRWAVNLSRIPFFGLAAYIFVRATNVPIQWIDDS